MVIAIIALLAAMLLPALRGAREQARRVVCLNSQRQVALAVRYFADDHNGWVNTNKASSVNNTWFLLLTNYVARSYDLVHSGCPDARDHGWWATGINTWFVGGDWWPSDPPTIPCHALHEVRSPDQVFLVSCCYSPYGGFPWWDLSVDGPYGTLPRHRGGGLSFVFVDGHGEWLKNRQWYTYPPAYEWCAVFPGVVCSSLLGN